MTESESYGISLVSIYFVPVNTYQRRKITPTNSTTSGPFILWKLLTNMRLSENRVFNNWRQVTNWYEMKWKLIVTTDESHSNNWRNWKWCKFYSFVVTCMSSVPQVNHELVIKSYNLDPTRTGVCRWLSDFSFTHLSHSPFQIKSSESQEIAEGLLTIWITRVPCTVLHIYSLSSDRST